jgi:DNA-binding LacI/PurR family transcriptional regulator
MAFPVMDALRHGLGLRIPEDVSVVGFDDVPQAAWGSYRLTTFQQPLPAMVEATVGLLRKVLADDAPSVGDRIVVPGRLVVRESARLPEEPSRPVSTPAVELVINV